MVSLLPARTVTTASWESSPGGSGCPPHPKRREKSEGRERGAGGPQFPMLERGAVGCQAAGSSHQEAHLATQAYVDEPLPVGMSIVRGTGGFSRSKSQAEGEAGSRVQGVSEWPQNICDSEEHRACSIGFEAASRGCQCPVHTQNPETRPAGFQAGRAGNHPWRLASCGTAR